MKNDLYRSRLADQMLSEHLKAFGAVCVEGPKWCGKTWLAQHQAVSACMIADPTDNFATRGRVELDINYAFSGGKPHLIDEWQEFPALWDATRYHVDQNAEPGQFILTGSSVPKTKGVMHSGTGRIASMRLRTMSLWESGNSEGLVSLSDLCEGKAIGIVPVRRPELREIIELILRGGWPGTLGMPFKYAIKTPVERDLRTYAESLGAELYHYQDYENHEIDAVVELSDGRWAAIEVKLGVNQEESAAAGLKKIAAQMSAGGCAPSALIIVVGLASAAYRRKDGVYVVPITALKP